MWTESNCLSESHGKIIVNLSLSVGGNAMDKYDLFYQVARDNYASQEWLNRELGTKGGTMVAFGGAIVAAGAVILSFSGTILSFITFLVLVIAFVFAVIFSLNVIWLNDWRPGPKVTNAVPILANFEHQDFTIEVATEYSISVEFNREVLGRKAEYLNLGALSLAVESIALAFLGVVSYV